MEELLTKTYEIIKKYEEKEIKSGNSFNIFDILHMSHDEVKISAFLYELLNNKGKHGQGDFFLKSFIKDVLCIDDINDDDIKNMRVDKERLTRKNRRIDLCLEGKSDIIAIEVKVYANDQNIQLFDYYNDIKRFNKKTKLYYLTLDGKSASYKSLNGLTRNDYYCISFANDIIPWIDNCIVKLKDYLNLKTSLYQFNYVLKTLCNQNKGEANMEIKELIKANKNNLTSALHIEKNIEEVKISIIDEFMKMIKSKLKFAGIKYEEDRFNENDGDVNNFYKLKSKTWPSVNIKYKSKKETNSDAEVYLRLEIEDNLFIGYCITSDGHDNRERLSSEIENAIISEHKDFKIASKNNWWICWKHIFIKNDTINFRTFNDNAISLVDPDVMQKVSDSVVQEIVNLLK